MLSFRRRSKRTGGTDSHSFCAIPPRAGRYTRLGTTWALKMEAQRQRVRRRSRLSRSSCRRSTTRRAPTATEGVTVRSGARRRALGVRMRRGARSSMVPLRPDSGTQPSWRSCGSAWRTSEDPWSQSPSPTSRCSRACFNPGLGWSRIGKA